MALVGFHMGPCRKNVVLIWVANLQKVRFCYRVVVGIPGRTSVPILNLSTPPGYKMLVNVHIIDKYNTIQYNAIKYKTILL